MPFHIVVALYTLLHMTSVQYLTSILDHNISFLTFSLDVIEYLLLDEVGVATERDHSRRAWWSLGSFWWGD
jgi:hypothetical protein